MALLDKAKRYFTQVIDDDDNIIEEESESGVGAEEEKIEIKYRGINSFKQVKEVCDCLRKDFPVVINLQTATSEVICRATDYLSGVLDAIDGEIVAIGANMWICTPKNVVVEGKYTELIQSEIENKNGYGKQYANKVLQETQINPMPTSPYSTRK